jgi:hypothetical protein
VTAVTGGAVAVLRRLVAVVQALSPQVHQLEAALGGRLVGWRHRIVRQSIMTDTALVALRVNNGIDQTSVEGATNLPYARARYGGRTEHHRDRRATADTRGWLHRRRDIDTASAEAGTQTRR